MSATHSTGSSPTGCHLWWVPRCTTASPGPSTTGSAGRAARARGVPRARCRRRWSRWCATRPRRGRSRRDGRTVRKQIPPPRGSSSHPPSGSPPCSGAPSAPPGLPQLDQRAPSPAPRDAQGGVPSASAYERPSASVAATSRRGPSPSTLVAVSCGSAGGRRGGIGAQHAHRRRCTARRSTTRQRCAVAALDHDVAGPELVLAVVEAEHDATVDHDHEVEGVGGVHAGLGRGRRPRPGSSRPRPRCAGEADDAHRAAARPAARGGPRPSGSSPPSSTVVGRAVEPQPGGRRAKPLAADRARRLGRRTRSPPCPSASWPVTTRRA